MSMVTVLAAMSALQSMAATWGRILLRFDQLFGSFGAPKLIFYFDLLRGLLYAAKAFAVLARTPDASAAYLLLPAMEHRTQGTVLCVDGVLRLW